MHRAMNFVHRGPQHKLVSINIILQVCSPLLFNMTVFFALMYWLGVIEIRQWLLQYLNLVGFLGRS